MTNSKEAKKEYWGDYKCLVCKGKFSVNHGKEVYIDTPKKSPCEYCKDGVGILINKYNKP